MTDQEKIEQYLAQGMSAQEREVFEQRLSNEPELSEALQLYQATQDFFSRRNPALEASLNQLGQRYIGHKPWYRRWWLGILFGLVGVGATFYAWPLLFPSQTESTTLSPQSEDRLPTDTSSLAPPAPEAPQKPSASENVETDRDGSENEKDNSSTALPPIAQATPADYTPNPDLEELFNIQVRSEAFFALTAPGRILTIDLDEALWQVEAQTTSRAPLELRLYTNLPADFYEDRRQLTQTLATIGQGDTLSIVQNLPTPKSAGLYYWLILDANSEEIQAAGKIIVAE